MSLLLSLIGPIAFEAELLAFGRRWVDNYDK
jgi:hypothetical protein